MGLVGQFGRHKSRSALKQNKVANPGNETLKLPSKAPGYLPTSHPRQGHSLVILGEPGAYRWLGYPSHPRDVPGGPSAT